MDTLVRLGCWRQPSGRHLDPVDVDAAHAATAIDEEDEFAVDSAQVGADGLEVRTEVEHDHRVVEDVLVEASADDVHLENNHSRTLRSITQELNRGASASTDQIQSQTQRINITDSFQTARGEPLKCFHRNTPLWPNALCFNLLVKSTSSCWKHERMYKT